MNKKIKIGYQGVAGAYSHTSIKKLIKSKQIDEKNIEEYGYDDFPSLIDSLILEEIDYAMIPVENSTTGLITRSLDLFRNREIMGIEEFYLEIKHCLWGTKNSDIEGITKVYSHPEALSQCDKFFKKYSYIHPETYSDTAKAAKYISEKNDSTLGAIASSLAGELYGLKKLKAEIQTENTNTTRFFLTRKINKLEIKEFEQKSAFDGFEEKSTLDSSQSKSDFYVSKEVISSKMNIENSKIMFFIELKHEIGALSKLLNLFSTFDCNLKALNARPLADKPFQYGFFIEVDWSKTNVEFSVLLKSIKYVCESVQIIANIRDEKFIK